MPHPDLLAPTIERIGLVDLLVVGLVVVAVVSALRRGRGLGGAVGTLLGAVLLAWLGSVALTMWAPAPVAAAVGSSAFADTFPVPDRALDDLGVRRGPR